MAPLCLRKTRTVDALLVGMVGGTIRLYNGKHLVCELETHDTISAIRFGRFGREEASMILVHKSGALTIKMLQRRANLEVSSVPPGPPPEQDIPLNVPKKTKLYVEQTQRERDQATEMHRIFQRDLCKLRLSTARAYVKIITDGQGPVSYGSGASLRLNAQVQGLGPAFKIKLNIQNAGNKSMTNVPMTCGYNHDLYRLKNGLRFIPLLVPGLLYHYDVDVECIDKNGGADAIRIFICNPKSCVPVISAIVNMPMSEPILDEEA
jgi:Bardet-Biedl syndrome 1 protein